MIHYITGKLVATEPGALIIDTAGNGGGLAYRLFVSDNTLAALASKLDEKVKVYTYLSVREDAMDLYGFHSNDERGAFNQLISVSGVGPKAALAILSVLTPDSLAVAVSSQDAKAIARANGVGAKIAARVVLELKDKLTKELGRAAEVGAAPDASNSKSSGKYSDALNALIVLGYSRSEAAEALRGLDTSLSLEGMITAALKKLMR